jgi:probable O-glycosylation ligase (exosortase A-associated)
VKGWLFTYVLTFGGALVALFNPFYGLLAYIAFAILRPETLWFWSVTPGNYSRIVAIFTIVGWVISGCGKWALGKATSVVLLLVGFLIWAAISWVVAAENQRLAWGYVELNLKIVLPFLVGMTTIDSVRKLKLLAWVIVLGQGFVAYEMNLVYYQGYNRLYWEGFTGDNNCTAIAMVAVAGPAFFLAMSSPRLWQKGVALLAFALMVNAVMFSFSRGGLLGLIITGVVAFFLVPKKPKHYLAFALAVMACFYLAGKEVRERFITTFADKEVRDKSAQSRVEMWRDCWDLMKRYPILGCGPENFREKCVEYGWPRGKYAHSLWMQTGAELGFPGVGMLLMFYLWSSIRLFPMAWGSGQVPDPWLRDAARMVIAALVGFVVSAQFVSLWQLEVPFYVALVGAGALKLASTLQPAPGLVSQPARPQRDLRWAGRGIVGGPRPVGRASVRTGGSVQGRQA